MELKLRNMSGVTVIEIEGEIDLFHAGKLKKLVTTLFEKNVNRVIINMQKVSYIDSSGIGALLHIFSESKKRKLRAPVSRRLLGRGISVESGNTHKKPPKQDILESSPLVAVQKGAGASFHLEVPLAHSARIRSPSVYRQAMIRRFSSTSRPV